MLMLLKYKVKNREYLTFENCDDGQNIRDSCRSTMKYPEQSNTSMQ